MDVIALGAGGDRRGGRAARHRADRGAARAAVAAGRRADPVLRRRCGRAEGGDPRRATRAADARRPAAASPSSRCPPARIRTIWSAPAAARRSRRCSRDAEPLVDRLWAARTGRRAARHARAARRPASAACATMPPPSPIATCATNIAPSSAAASTRFTRRRRRSAMRPARRTRAHPGSRWSPPPAPSRRRQGGRPGGHRPPMLAARSSPACFATRREIARHIEALAALHDRRPGRSARLLERWSMPPWKNGRLIASASLPYWRQAGFGTIAHELLPGRGLMPFPSPEAMPTRNGPARSRRGDRDPGGAARSGRGAGRGDGDAAGSDIGRGVRAASVAREGTTGSGRAACRSGAVERGRQGFRLRAVDGEDGYGGRR